MFKQNGEIHYLIINILSARGDIFADRHKYSNWFKPEIRRGMNAWRNRAEK